MAQLDIETKTAINITAETELLNFVYSGTSPKEVYARVDLGTTANPIAGNGLYSIRVYIDSVLVVPISDIIVGAGVIKAIAFSKPMMLDSGDVVSIRVVGLAGDTAVTTITSLRDATPARAEEIYGAGAVIVDHDYGGPDNLSYLLDAAGVDNACIHCYKKTDYDAGNRANSFIQARTTTTVGGRWTKAMMLDPATTYTLVYFKQGITGPDTKEVTVT